MSTYIEKSNCRGAKPAGIVGRRHTLRPDLVGRLLCDRHAARFLVAPDGYGKSSVAFEYAQIVFEFKHVFWLKCLSPCFLRDLDSDVLYTGVLSSDRDAHLVIFDGVPHLDANRSGKFKDVIEAFCAAGIEVMVTCTPSVDTFSADQMDGVVLRASDLMLTDDELAVEQVRGNPRVLGPVNKAERVACLVWDAPRGHETLIKGLRAEDLPGELGLLAVVALVLGRGSFDELERMVKPERFSEDASILAAQYPFLGLDEESRTFQSLDVSIEGLAGCWGCSAEELAMGSMFDSGDELCFAVAKMLCERGEVDRACDFMGHFASKEAAAGWLSVHGWGFIAAGKVLGASVLCGKVRKRAGSCKERLRAIHAWAMYVLGDFAEAVAECNSVLSASSGAWQDKAAACVLGARLEGTSVARSISAKARQCLSLASFDSLGDNGDHRADEFLDWLPLLQLLVDACDGEMTPQSAWEALWEPCCGVGGMTVAQTSVSGAGFLSPPAMRSKLLSAVWSIETCAEHRMRQLGDGAFGAADAFPADMAPLVSFAYGSLAENPAWLDSHPWLAYVAVRALELAEGAGQGMPNTPLPDQVTSSAHSVAVFLHEQASQHKKMAEASQRKREEYAVTHPDSMASAQLLSRRQKAASLQPIPRLRITLFGGLSVKVDDDLGDIRTPSREKGQIALAMLAVNRGREVSRERMSHALWPDSDEDFCKRNFYVVWSGLKKTLNVEGSCPYLIRTQTGYKLDWRYVATDLEDFDDLCRSLMFGSGSYGWEEIFDKINRDFSEELLPNIRGNVFVDGLRSRCTVQLVDALVTASMRMTESGESRGSLWFAREALRRDESREDAYIALMDAQITSGQRGAALDTYFACRRYLSEELGIDPSSKVMDLYRSIIEVEEDL